MKIALLSAFYPFRGGISQFGTALYKALIKEHEVQALTFTTQYPKILFPGKTQFVEQKDTAESVPAKRIMSSVNPLTWYRTSNAIHHFDPDLLVTRFWMPFFSPSMGTVARNLKKKSTVIGIVDNAIPHESRLFDKAMTRYYINQHHGFVVMTEAVGQDLCSLAGRDVPYELILHPVYGHFGARVDKNVARSNLGIPSEAKVILFFGLIRDYKGLDRLIKAFQLLDRNYHLIIAGECYGSFDQYKAQINEHESIDRVHVYNRYIPDQEVPVYFSASDVCVLPYKSATQSGITAMSFHFNVPVIATDVGGLKETIVQDKTGLTFEYKGPESLVQNIQEFFIKRSTVDYSEHIAVFKSANSWDRFSERMVNFGTSLCSS